MQQHKVQRRMVVVLHIKIDRQVIERIPPVYLNIIPKLSGRNPHRLRPDLRLISQKLTVSPVFQHVSDHRRQIAQGLPQILSVYLIVHEPGQTSLGLCGNNPGIKFRI